PPIVFNALVALVALAAVWEFYRMAEKTGHPVGKTIGIGAAGRAPGGAGRACPRRRGPALGTDSLRDSLGERRQRRRQEPRRVLVRGGADLRLPGLPRRAGLRAG